MARAIKKEALASGIARHGKRQIALELVHNPVGVGAVGEEMRLGRANDLSRFSLRREGPGNGRRLAIIAQRAKSIVVCCTRRQTRHHRSELIVQDKPLLERRPFRRLASAFRPELPLDNA